MSTSTTTPIPTAQYEWLGERLHYDRDDVAEKLRSQLLNDQIVVMLGPQGSGKSTLAIEDLCPLLKKTDTVGSSGTADWRVAITRPYNHPITNLAHDLAAPGVLYARGQKEFTFDQETEAQLRNDSHALVHLYERAVKEGETRFNLLLIINQKQDFYRYEPYITKGEDEHFLKLLLTAAYAEIPVYLIFVTDSENINHFSRYRGLPELINNYRFEVPALSAAEIGRKLRELSSEEAPEEEESQNGQEKPGKTPSMEEVLEQIVQAYQGLLDSSDKFALFKLNHFLRYTYHKWRREAPDSNIAVFYQQQLQKGRFFFSLNLQLEDKYQQLADKPLLQQAAAFFFKALTERGIADRVVRRSATLGELETLSRRGAPANLPKNLALRLLRHFNGKGEYADYPHSFLELAQPANAVPTHDSIVDIKFDAIPGTWLRLRNWVDEESLHTNIYISSYTTALDYLDNTPKEELIRNNKRPEIKESKGSFREWLRELRNSLKSIRWHQKQQQAKKAQTTPSLMLEGATLDSANKWLKYGRPTEMWARRYETSRLRRLSSAQREVLANLLGESEASKITKLALARWFVERSRITEQQRTEDEDAQRLLQIQQANKQRRIALILATAAMIMFGVSLVLWQRAHVAKQNLELVDLVEILNSNNILESTTQNNLAEIERIQPEVANDPEIKEWQDVLHFLIRQNLLLIKPDETEPSFTALRALDEFYDDLQQGNEPDHTSPFIHKLDTLCQRLVTESRGKPFQQYPYVFYALTAEGKILKKDTNQVIKIGAKNKSLIEDLASNPLPAKRYQHAFGDRNGTIVIVHRGHDPGSWMGYYQTSVVGGGISSLEYNSSGTTLFVGTTQGDLYYIRDVSDPTGQEVDIKQLSISSSILQGRSISQIIPINNRDDLILVRTGSTIHLISLALNNDNYTFLNAIPFSVDGTIDQISHLALAEEDIPRYAVITGKNQSIVYDFDPTEARNFLRERFTISHQGRSMHRAALKTYPDSLGGKSWLTLGGEIGEFWYSENYEDLFSTAQSNLVLDEHPSFEIVDAHRSTIMSIDFNSHYPQLATASLDGYIQLWNLERMGDVNDRVKLKNNGQGIWDLCYINPDQVIIAENINTQVWRTTIKSQYEEWKRLLKD